MNHSTAVLLCGHGSRDPDAVREFDALAERLRPRLDAYDVARAYLEFAKPTIREGLDRLVKRGAARIICQPGMLLAAGHVKNDLPSEIHAFGHDNPEIEVTYGRDLAVDVRLLDAARTRIEAAEAEVRAPVRREDTLLLVVGRGTRDPDANSDVSKVARMLWEGMGFGWAETAYSGVAHPLGDAGLDHAARLGYRRVVVFPYFLFTGVLIRRIYDWVDEAARKYPDIEFFKAGYLNDHAGVLDAFVARIGEAFDGEARMNCALCKYRERIVGFEDAQGAPQEGHHHHVRGIGVDHGHGHDHGHET